MGLNSSRQAAVVTFEMVHSLTVQSIELKDCVLTDDNLIKMILGEQSRWQVCLYFLSETIISGAFGHKGCISWSSIWSKMSIGPH